MLEVIGNLRSLLYMVICVQYIVYNLSGGTGKENIEPMANGCRYFNIILEAG